ncbi:MAG: hypothetical protein ASARMPREDX12_000419 [Alectoria sarmentosa]|nr:MAG: hypothetical protein ASARMPREDX12_000419 [Alectoria sarmentosa]CAD6589794.1 MAG: hypothetical protein ASARMPRED_004269 [Alectoria sarmentosa]
MILSNAYVPALASSNTNRLRASALDFVVDAGQTSPPFRPFIGQRRSDSGPIASVGELEALDISAMVGPSELKGLWRKYREYRAAKKQRSQASSESSSRGSKGSTGLEEATSMIVGLGLETEQRSQASSGSSNRGIKGSMVLEEATGIITGYETDTKLEQQCIEYALDIDPRFIDNPDGIGCSRTYEEPDEPYEFDEQSSFPQLAAWRTDSIDRVKGKRKGRMPGDRADDRYKSLLDILASRPKFSAKKFSLLKGVRDLAWTR